MVTVPSVRWIIEQLGPAVDVCRLSNEHLHPWQQEGVMLGRSSAVSNRVNATFRVLQWDLCFTGDAYVFKYDGSDLLPTTLLAMEPHPWSIYERLDAVGGTRGAPGEIYIVPKESWRRRRPAPTAAIAATAPTTTIARVRVKNPLAIVTKTPKAATVKERSTTPS